MNLYFNNAFSKQPLLEVEQAMRPFLRVQFENPLTESEGADQARTTLENTRAQIAALVRAQASEVFFVSSGTEANNWALKGAFLAVPEKSHFVISAIEHFSVYQTAQFLGRRGCEITVVPVDREGLCDPDEVKRAIRPTTVLVSVLAASDEIGVIQDLRAISSLKSSYPEVLFHTDAIQFLCYESMNLQDWPFDLVSVSSNALYGPPGIAALIIRQGTRIIPLLHGGMQEEGMRPGLQSIALAAGFGSAARINLRQKGDWKQNIARLQKAVFERLDRLNVRITGSRKRRVVDNIHCLLDADGEAALALLGQTGIAASSGSTCYQFAQKESHVLQALGINQDESRGSILFTLGANHTSTDIDTLLNAVDETVRHLRALKP